MLQHPLQPLQPLQPLHPLQPLPLSSSAFPHQKSPEHHSIFHQLLQHSTPILQQPLFSPISTLRMRLTKNPNDIIEIWNLQMEWFPLKYGHNFYERILEGRYRCLLAEVQVEIGDGVLKGVLGKRYQQEVQKGKEETKKGYNGNPVYIQPSKYFQSQGIQPHTLTTTSTSPPFSTSTPTSKPIKIWIIIGIMVFDLTTSSGMLQSSWFRESLFGTPNSIYINTIGTLYQYRKNGIAKIMLQWLIQKVKKQQIFRYIHLHVIQYNQAAIRLYQKMGFQRLEQYEAYYHVDGKAYRGILLGMFLNGGRKRVGWVQWIKSFWNN